MQADTTSSRISSMATSAISTSFTQQQDNFLVDTLALWKKWTLKLHVFNWEIFHLVPATFPEISRELLKKHDVLFASRPITMATEYSSGGFITTTLINLRNCNTQVFVDSPSIKSFINLWVKRSKRVVKIHVLVFN